MVTLNNSMKMNDPNTTPDFWANVVEVAKYIAPWSFATISTWKIINTVFKYFSDSRDAELREIVNKEVKPKMDEMSAKIEALSKNIWSLEQLLKK